MDATTDLGRLLGMSGAYATATDAPGLLSETLPVLASVAQADAVLVVRRERDGLAVDHSVGTALEPVEIAGGAQGLVPVDVPDAWAGIAHVEAQALPGRAGVLVLAWSHDDDRSPALQLATSMLVSGLARIEAATSLADLEARVDNAQQLANMGDYDWHIPSDTNRWSDQLYRIYGHEPGSFNPSYERFLSLIHPDDRDRITGVHQQAYGSGEPYAMMERIVRPDGELRYLSSNGEVVLDENGAPTRMRGTCIDVTDRVLAEREREHSAARLRGLVEAAPDAILVVGAEERVLDANPRACELLGGDPIGIAVTQVLPAGSGTGGQGIAGLGLSGERLSLDVTTVTVRADDAADEEVLAALFLRDAAARIEGETMAARLSEAQLRRRQALEINDNVVQGLVAASYALDAEQYPVVASYIDRTLVAARAMMDDLLEPLNGEDLKPGDLVRSAPAVIGVPDKSDTEATPDHAGGHRVLVVDDAEDLRMLLRTRLSRIEGLDVVGEAADGLVAIERARELQPDLVLLDLAMPRMDGLEALPHIREAVPDVRIIVFSGFHQNTLAEKAMAAGADRYVVKGGPVRELIDLVQQVLVR